MWLFYILPNDEVWQEAQSYVCTLVEVQATIAQSSRGRSCDRTRLRQLHRRLIFPSQQPEQMKYKSLRKLPVTDEAFSHSRCLCKSFLLILVLKTLTGSVEHDQSVLFLLQSLSEILRPKMADAGGFLLPRLLRWRRRLWTAGDEIK